MIHNGSLEESKGLNDCVSLYKFEYGKGGYSNTDSASIPSVKTLYFSQAVSLLSVAHLLRIGDYQSLPRILLPRC